MQWLGFSTCELAPVTDRHDRHICHCVKAVCIALNCTHGARDNWYKQNDIKATSNAVYTYRYFSQKLFFIVIYKQADFPEILSTVRERTMLPWKQAGALYTACYTVSRTIGTQVKQKLIINVSYWQWHKIASAQGRTHCKNLEEV